MKVKVTIYDDFGRVFTQSESTDFPFSTLIDSDSTNPTRKIAIDHIEMTALEATQNAITKATLEPKPGPIEPPKPIDLDSIYGGPELRSGGRANLDL